MKQLFIDNLQSVSGG